jgi:hypothetical protein
MHDDPKSEETLVTEIRHPNYSFDLPGEWESEPGAEEGSTVYLQTDGPGMLTVMLLGVKPMFAIADRANLLSDYMHHRATFEAGQATAMSQSEPVSDVVGEAHVGTWLGLELDIDRRTVHHVVIMDALLADFLYEAVGLEAPEFNERAESIFRTVAVSV